MMHNVAYLDPDTYEPVSLEAESKGQAELAAFMLTGRWGLTFTHAVLYRDGAGRLAYMPCECGSEDPDAIPDSE